MSFTPGSALYPALNVAFLLETKKRCCYKHFSSPQSGHFHPQTATSGQLSLGRAEAAAGAEFIFAGAHHGEALVADQDCEHPGSLEAGAAPRWVVGRATTHIGASGGAPHAGRDGTGTPCPAWGSSSPRHPTQPPAGCSPAPHPYLCPLSFPALIKQEGCSLRLHWKEEIAFATAVPRAVHSSGN